jgi:chorismate dehydratase
MAGPGTLTPTPTPRRTIRLGVVSFVNTLPLIDGLENLADLDLRFTVPSLLLDQLVGGEVDLALCSSIDYQQSDVPLIVVPVGLLGSDGTTLTVRLYSSQPLDRIGEVYCDTDSHTSVVLMRILLKELYGIAPRLIDFDARERVADNKPIDWPQAMLLIGDKVVTDSPPAIRYPHQLDLGEAWARLTGLPFVFGMWLTRPDCDPSILATAAAVLDRQRRHNRQRLDLIVHRRALGRGWPADLAAAYLKRDLAFEWTPQRRAGLELFFDKACQHKLAKHRRPLEIFG